MCTIYGQEPRSTYFQYKCTIQLAILQILHADKRLEVFPLLAPGLDLSSFMRLDGRTDIPFLKLAWSVLRLELEARVLPPLKGNVESHKMNSNTDMGTLL